PTPDFESGTFDHSATSPVAPALQAGGVNDTGHARSGQALRVFLWFCQAVIDQSWWRRGTARNWNAVRFQPILPL
ncbi:MAG: hypothetical protein ABI858_08520, partial [Pseudoxanthomonas sp.]